MACVFVYCYVMLVFFIIVYFKTNYRKGYVLINNNKIKHNHVVVTLFDYVSISRSIVRLY
jgi:hypothetical protein